MSITIPNAHQLSFLTWLERISFFSVDFQRDLCELGASSVQATTLTESNAFKNRNIVDVFIAAQHVAPDPFHQYMTNRWLKFNSYEHNKDQDIIPLVESQFLFLHFVQTECLNRNTMSELLVQSGVSTGNAFMYTFSDAVKVKNFVQLYQGYGLKDEEGTLLKFLQTCSLHFNAETELFKVLEQSEQGPELYPTPRSY